MQVPSTMTQDQNQQIFERIRPKLEAEFAAGEEESRAKHELMVKE